MATEADDDAAMQAVGAKDMVGLMAFVEKAGKDAKLASCPLITVCAESDFTAGVLRLIEEGADVNACDEVPRTALFYAQSTAAVEALLAAGADKDAKEPSGVTPLFHWASDGRNDLAAALIDAGADVNAADEYGWTPLILACRMGHKRIVELLMAAGADPTPQYDGRAAEEWAIERGHPDIAAIIRAGAALAAERAAAREEEIKERERPAAVAAATVEETTAIGPVEGSMVGEYRLHSPLSVGRSMNKLWLADHVLAGQAGDRVVIKLFASADAFQHECNALIALGKAGCAVVKLLAAVESVDVGGTTMHALVLPQGSMDLLTWSHDDHGLLERKAVLGAMALAIAEVHACGWMVGDVKPDNVVMFDGKWRLIDFGAAVRIGSPVSGEMSVAYMPPEQARAVRDGSTLTAHASYDVWCFGQSVLTVLRGGNALFAGKSDGEVMDELLRDGPLSVGSLQSGSAQRLLVGHCLRKDSAARSSMAVVLGDSFMASTTTASKLVSAVDGGSDVDASVSAAMKEAMAAHAHKLLAASISKEVSSALRTVLSGEIGGMAARLEEMARNMAESGEAHAEQLAEVAELVDGMLEGGSGSGGAVAMEEVKMEEVAPASGSMSIDDFLATVKPKFAAKYAAVFHEQDIDTLAELVKAGLDDAFASDIGLTAGASRLIRSALTRVRLC
eukprot:PLAT11614.11.p1 GENE.PLAT11614.11~~PLAT11614.11.p1  ORF type:complete len:677 (-),score=217.18 PLAT11614.11:252-2282(-)